MIAFAMERHAADRPCQLEFVPDYGVADLVGMWWRRRLGWSAACPGDGDGLADLASAGELLLQQFDWKGMSLDPGY